MQSEYRLRNAGILKVRKLYTFLHLSRLSHIVYPKRYPHLKFEMKMNSVVFEDV